MMKSRKMRCAGHVVESSWNVMAHGDEREGKWGGNWQMEWVASTLHTTSEHGVSSITTADAQTSAASIRLNWRICRFKWTRPFRLKTKSGFCACAITFQTQSTYGREGRNGDHLEGLDVYGRIILKRILKKEYGGMDWINLAQERDKWRNMLNMVMDLCVS